MSISGAEIHKTFTRSKLIMLLCLIFANVMDARVSSPARRNAASTKVHDGNTSAHRHLTIASDDESPLFYNVIEITDPPGDALPGSPDYVDILKITVRQIGQYVQFIWEAAGNPINNDDQDFFLMLDTDLNPMTGQNWNGCGGELVISVHSNQNAKAGLSGVGLHYFNAAGEITREETGSPAFFEGNRFYVNLEKLKIPGDHFNLFFQTFGPTTYRDIGPLVRIDLQPAQPEVKVVVEAESMVLRDNPPLIAIPDKDSVIQLHAYMLQGDAKLELLPQDLDFSVWHPDYADPLLGDPDSIVSVNSNLQARYLREGYVFLSVRDRSTKLYNGRVIIATGKYFGDAINDSVLAVFPPSYKLAGSAFSFGDMLTNYPSFMRTVNMQYKVNTK